MVSRLNKREGKVEIVSREATRIADHFTYYPESAAVRVSNTCKVLAHNGHGGGLSGQVSAKISMNQFMTQSLGFGLEETEPENLLTVDGALSVIDGAGIPNPANRFHLWLYDRRPDIQCVVHTHPFYSSALSMLGTRLEVAHMDSCILYDRVAHLSEWPGVPVGNDEGQIIADALGDASAILLANHGLVAVGSSIEEACVLAVQFERAAKMQLTASSNGNIQRLDPKLALEARQWVSTPTRVNTFFSYLCRQLSIS